jgi:mannose-6-phosphate isomerase-like protein (cupin superfamily)
MRRHAVSERELTSTRIERDTASRTVAIDAAFGSEVLELHVVRFDPGRSRPRALEGLQEIMYAVSGRGTLVVDAEPHELEPGTAAYLVAGESYEVENPGPDELLVISATASTRRTSPSRRAPASTCRRCSSTRSRTPATRR